MSGIFKPFTRQNNLSRSSVSSGLELIREGRRRANRTWNRPDYPLVRPVGSDTVKRLALAFVHADEDRSRTQRSACGSAAWPALKHSHRGISSEEATSRGNSDVFCRSANGPNEDWPPELPSNIDERPNVLLQFHRGRKKGKRVSTEHKTTNLMNSWWWLTPLPPKKAPENNTTDKQKHICFPLTVSLCSVQ